MANESARIGLCYDILCKGNHLFTQSHVDHVIGLQDERSLIEVKCWIEPRKCVGHRLGLGLASESEGS